MVGGRWQSETKGRPQNPKSEIRTEKAGSFVKAMEDGVAGRELGLRAGWLLFGDAEALPVGD